jgi:DNA gyrase subunit B
MEELIARGHLFIAQPPLYKVSRRKQEIYLKDNGELSRFLLDRVADEFRLVLGTTGIDLSGDELRSALLACESWHATLDSLERRGFPSDVVVAALDLTEGDDHPPGSAAYANALATELADLGYDVRVELDEEHGISEVVCGIGVNGRAWEVRLGRVLSDSGHFRRAKQQLAQIAPLRVGPYHIERNGERATVETLRELVTYVYDVAKRGLGIQRYKGLGEMNPEQLRETTMARDTRRLVQLTVSARDNADQLMDMLLAKKRARDRRSWLEKKGDLAEV